MLRNHDRSQKTNQEPGRLLEQIGARLDAFFEGEAVDVRGTIAELLVVATQPGRPLLLVTEAP